MRTEKENTVTLFELIEPRKFQRKKKIKFRFYFEICDQWIGGDVRIETSAYSQSHPYRKNKDD